jgi:hypothetical protein
MTMKPKGESHRIYWQQWLSSSVSAAHAPQGRRELITSSAAIRISPDAARARHVTKLLRDTLNLSSLENKTDGQGNEAQDSLVLVGTLYSLPPDYVRFEHEPAKKQPAVDTSNANGTGEPLQLPNFSPSSDPFHVIKTLAPDDNPLQWRDRMIEHLKSIQDSAPNGRDIISPKIQWYFVPGHAEPSSPIPSCIDLDGYSTSMEPDDSDDETDSEDDANDAQEPDLNLIFSRCPWLSTEPSTPRPPKEVRRYMQLSQCQSTPNHQCVSGYLLKQSRKDPHAWRRVHCVLTDDFLWYMTRVKNSSTMGRHGRIDLVRALLLEATSEYTALFRTPHAFEVVSAKGTSHIFRATNRPLQSRWIQALSDRIVERHENSLMAHAELIVADESIARNKRLWSVAVQPLWKSCVQDGSCGPNVLRLGMEVAEYRERCRHVQAVLPAKQPVVVVSESHRNHTASPNKPNAEPAVAEPLDPETKERVQATWDAAVALLTRATQVAMEVQSSSHHKNISQEGKRMSKSLETLCRHVDYVITGQFRQLSDGQFTTGENGRRPTHGRDTSESPPPIDLFDLLLAELQAVTSDTNTRRGDLENGSTKNPQLQS